MAQRRWIRGNTHTHTTYSDGDSSPEVVVGWYAERGYDFLFLTDHNALIPEDHLARLQRTGLMVWQGEEVTMAAVHVNGLGMQELIAPPWPGKSLLEPEVVESHGERIRWAVERILQQGGVATINHPNFLWTLTLDDLLAGGDFGLLEVANGHNLVHNDGDATHPSTEEIWDRLLSEGRQVWGVASDDAHHFQSWGSDRSNPGRGWLQVEVDSPRLESVLDALRAGRFYSSSGLELDEYRACPEELVLELRGESASIELIGPEGRVLDAVEDTAARFSLVAHRSQYVRARATNSIGQKLWTQPLFL